MDLVFKKQEDFILNISKNIKCMLFDTSNSKQSINNLIDYKKLIESNYFYFDYLHNKKRSKLNIDCVIVLSNINIKFLIDELSDPFYSNYFILFSDSINCFTLEILAGADRNSVIKEIYEINFNLIKLDNFLYLCDKNNIYYLLSTLQINPSIYFLPEDENFCRDLFNKTINFKNNGKLLFLDRNFDLITPLLIDWHYQSAIHQNLIYQNNKVLLKSKNNEKPKEYLLNDDFYKKNRFNNIKSIGNNINKLIKELEVKKLNIEKKQFDDLSSATKFSYIAQNHLNIYNMVLEECMKNKEISEFEISLLKNDKNTKNIDFNIKNKLKIEILKYLINIYKDDNSKNYKKKPNNDKEELNYLLNIFINKYKPNYIGYKYTFNDQSDLLSYECPLKKILKHLVKNKLNFKYFSSKSKISDFNIFIIYLKNGLTYREYREILLYSQVLNIKVILLSDKMINFNEILKKIIK